MGYRTLLAIGFTLASAIKTVSQFAIGHHTVEIYHIVFVDQVGHEGPETRQCP